MVRKKKKPKFLRQGARFLKRVKKRWRRPRGSQSKMRKRKKGKPRMPSIGYGAPKRLRGLHPCGLREVLVHNIKELERIDPKVEAVKIATGVGKRKREELIKRAAELKIRLLNP
jgi:large subunit ribosomal protein L32e